MEGQLPRWSCCGIQSYGQQDYIISSLSYRGQAGAPVHLHQYTQVILVRAEGSFVQDALNLGAFKVGLIGPDVT